MMKIEKKKELKSEKPKDGREATVLSEPSFDPRTYPGKKIKKLKSKKQRRVEKQLFCQSQVLIMGPVRETWKFL